MLDCACDFCRSRNIGKNAEPHHFIELIGQIVMDQNMLCNECVGGVAIWGGQEKL
jgi:hypothetical protein